MTSSWPCRIWDPGGFKLPDMEHVRWYIERFERHNLVGGFNHLETYQAMGRIIPYIMEHKTWLKPPTSNTTTNH